MPFTLIVLGGGNANLGAFADGVLRAFVASFLGNFRAESNHCRGDVYFA